MTTTNENRSYSILAQSDLSAQATRYRAITFLGALVAANPAAGAPAGAAGILTSSTRSGEVATAVYHGITKAYAGAAVQTVGWPLAVGSSGYIFAAVSGGHCMGRALETANSGDLFKINVDFSVPAAWNGLG
jgi:hypothetical protein